MGKHLVICVDCGTQFEATPESYYIKKTRRYICPECFRNREIASMNIFYTVAIESIETGQISISDIHHRYGLGFADAARLIDNLESFGVIGPFNVPEGRSILMTKEAFIQKYHEKTII